MSDMAENAPPRGAVEPASGGEEPNQKSSKLVVKMEMLSLKRRQR